LHIKKKKSYEKDKFTNLLNQRSYRILLFIDA